ncbi:MAG: NUDIX domain-containing protein [Minwuia sp.]|uniref:NUDIX domain-containing protein n=1 Tax=Minwuia sp. TaxID=2493630 RepID=UPI003A8653FB
MASSDYHFPAVTADIVALAGSGILLIRRKNPPYRDHWALPGGFLDPDETIETCAARELAEETGVTAHDLQLVGVYSEPDRDPRGRTVSVAFLARFDEQPPAEAADDAAELHWFPADDLPPLAFDHARIIADALKLA